MQGICGVHPEHSVHFCDARRVEIQRLVERLCDLSSQKGGIQYWEVGGAMQPRIDSELWKARLESERRAWRSAHVEHSVHICDAGRVEIQLLVERLCFLSYESKGGRIQYWEFGGAMQPRIDSELWKARLESERRAYGGVHT